MDAHAHLLSLGWAGPGHSLDSRPSASGTYKQKGHRGLAYDPSKDPLKVGNTGVGLVKPLLLSQRKNRFGVGKKPHEAPAGNEWWLKGFESALGNIGKSESERSSGICTPTNGLTIGKHGSLYTFFTQGQTMEGTIDLERLKRASRKRKSDEFEQDNTEKLNPRSTKSRTAASAKDFELVGAFMRERDREKKRRKEEKENVTEIEQFAQIQEFFGVAEKERKKKKRKSEKLAEESTDATADNIPEKRVPETEEERRQRRRRRKQEKAAKAAGNGEGHNTHEESEDLAAKAARKAERKRRKMEKEVAKNR